MARTMRAATLFAGVALMALVLVACGGKKQDAQPSGTKPAGGQPTAGVLVHSPSGLKSYRYKLSVKATEPGGTASGAAPGASPPPNTAGMPARPGAAGTAGADGAGTMSLSMQAEGEFVAPDRSHSVTKMDLGFLTLNVETVQISGKAWSRTPGGQWQAGLGAAGGITGGAVDPKTLFTGQNGAQGDDALKPLNEKLAQLKGVSERVNTIDAVRYELKAAEFASLFDSVTSLNGMPTDGTVQLWISKKDGFPVRLVLQAGSPTSPDGQVEIQLEFSDLNSDKIQIQPPA